MSCFLLACFFWYSVVIGDAEIVEKVIPVSIQYVATPEDLALVGDKPSEAKVHLMGPKINLSSAELSRLSITVDLSEAKPGRQVFAISENDMNLPPKVQMLDATPSILTLELVHMEERELPVTPQLVGILPDYLKIAAINVKPKMVSVCGCWSSYKRGGFCDDHSHISGKYQGKYDYFLQVDYPGRTSTRG